jgi:hypothetical protein
MVQKYRTSDLSPIDTRSIACSLEVVKTNRPTEVSKPRRRKITPAKGRQGTRILGSRPLMFQMSLRGQTVDVKVVPLISTTTHVNYEVTISRGSKILDWVPTRAELRLISCAAGSHAELHTSH